MREWVCYQENHFYLEAAPLSQDDTEATSNGSELWLQQVNHKFLSLRSLRSLRPCASASKTLFCRYSKILSKNSSMDSQDCSSACWLYSNGSLNFLPNLSAPGLVKLCLAPG